MQDKERIRRDITGDDDSIESTATTTNNNMIDDIDNSILKIYELIKEIRREKGVEFQSKQHMREEDNVEESSLIRNKRVFKAYQYIINDEGTKPSYNTILKKLIDDVYDDIKSRYADKSLGGSTTNNTSMTNSNQSSHSNLMLQTKVIRINIPHTNHNHSSKNKQKLSVLCNSILSKQKISIRDIQDLIDYKLDMETIDPSEDIISIIETCNKCLQDNKIASIIVSIIYIYEQKSHKRPLLLFINTYVYGVVTSENPYLSYTTKSLASIPTRADGSGYSKGEENECTEVKYHTDNHIETYKSIVVEMI